LLLGVLHVRTMHLGIAVRRVCKIRRPRQRRTMLLLYLWAMGHLHVRPDVGGVAVVALRPRASIGRPTECRRRLDDDVFVVVVVLTVVLRGWCSRCMVSRVAAPGPFPFILVNLTIAGCQGIGDDFRMRGPRSARWLWAFLGADVADAAVLADVTRASRDRGAPGGMGRGTLRWRALGGVAAGVAVVGRAFRAFRALRTCSAGRGAVRGTRRRAGRRVSLGRGTWGRISAAHGRGGKAGIPRVALLVHWAQRGRFVGDRGIGALLVDIGLGQRGRRRGRGLDDALVRLFAVLDRGLEMAGGGHGCGGWSGRVVQGSGSVGRWELAAGGYR
jgi:hypothetical protein